MNGIFADVPGVNVPLPAGLLAGSAAESARLWRGVVATTFERWCRHRLRWSGWSQRHQQFMPVARRRRTPRVRQIRQIRSPSGMSTAQICVVAAARNVIGMPYVWGGDGPKDWRVPCRDLHAQPPRQSANLTVLSGSTADRRVAACCHRHSLASFVEAREALRVTPVAFVALASMTKAASFGPSGSCVGRRNCRDRTANSGQESPRWRPK